MRKTAIVLLISMILLLLPVTALAATVENVTVSVHPIIPGQAGQYNIGFYTSNSGALDGGTDRIILKFSSDFGLPSSISSGKVLINGTTLSSSYITISDNLIYLKLPSSLDIDDNSYVGITIPQSANIKTPLRGGTYNIIVQTSVDNAESSNNFSVSGTSIRDLEVSVSPGTVEEEAEYTITFEPRNSLVGGEDYIYVEFPEEASLPSSISTSDILINNKRPGAVDVDRTTHVVAMKLPSGLNIKNSTTVVVVISASASINNPEDADTYELGVFTSKDGLLVAEEYRVGLSISEPVVTVSPATGDQNAEYSIGFTTSAKGPLAAGEDYIYLYFPSGTYIPSSINNSYITVNGYTPKAVSCDRSKREIMIRMPTSINIQRDSYAQVVIKSGAGLKNPTQSGSYQLEVCTNVDTSKVKSQKYSISGTASSTSGVSVDLSTYDPEGRPEITIEFKLGSAELEGDDDEIIIIFPDEFTLPTSIRNDYITINGDEAADIDVDDEELIITVPEDLDEGEDVTIVIEAAAGIVNPEDADTYTFEIYTSQDSSRVESENIKIGIVDDIDLPQVEVVNTTPGETSLYYVFLFASKDWDLDDDEEITITFPSGTTVPTSISRSYIRVNDERAESVAVNGRVVTIELPDDLVIEEGDKLIVVFEEAAGIRNPSTAGNYKVKVVSPDKTYEVESKAYTIGTPTTPVTPPPAAGQQIIFKIGSTLASSGGVLVSLDAAPTIIEGRTMVLLRALGDALGAETVYSSTDQSITVKYNNKTMVFHIGSRIVDIDDTWVVCDVPPTIVNSRTLIPVRFVSEYYGATVNWNETTQEVTIIK